MRMPMAAALLALAGAAAAETWRWTDERGRVHFSDGPPPAGVEAERVDLPDAGERQPDAEARQRQQRALELLEKQARERQREDRREARDEEAGQQRECADKRRQLAELENNAPLMRKDFPGLLYQEAQEHERRTRALRQWIDENC